MVAEERQVVLKFESTLGTPGLRFLSKVCS